MTEEHLGKLIQMNERLLFVMGYAISAILLLGKHVPDNEKDCIYWVVEAMENVVYLDKPLPPIP